MASLGSGSRGNATLVQAEQSSVLVDCGFTLREIQRRATERQVDLASLDAILVTHEHSDHCSGVAGLARHYDIPVYLTHGTLASGRIDNCPQTRIFNGDTALHIGAFTIQAVTVPHDAREPVQYCFECGEHRAGVLTDLGSVTSHVRKAFDHCDLLLLEFNHDRQLLAEGPYPASLKRRVGGDWGHLSNTQAATLLGQLNLQRLKHLVVAHISEKNNSRDSVEAQLRQVHPDLLAKTVWASQAKGFDWIEAPSKSVRHVSYEQA
ncbi:MBL fold metallo-hydrolase [Congregibacter variabilis]|uniref:MBL fold metallo-hydrolase n=1 Tax=Congregibacter variabilis TaxID=3081200 RepID=A0ABZ0I7Q3_9GAMM|nr:MBL fold metallo-hydrolase [Congregibacter sp. IMCC43200]